MEGSGEEWRELLSDRVPEWLSSSVHLMLSSALVLRAIAVDAVSILFSSLAGLTPNKITFNSLIHACAAVGNFSRAMVGM